MALQVKICLMCDPESWLLHAQALTLHDRRRRAGKGRCLITSGPTAGASLGPWGQTGEQGAGTLCRLMDRAHGQVRCTIVRDLHAICTRTDYACWLRVHMRVCERWFYEKCICLHAHVDTRAHSWAHMRVRVRVARVCTCVSERMCASERTCRRLRAPIRVFVFGKTCACLCGCTCTLRARVSAVHGARANMRSAPGSERANVCMHLCTQCPRHHLYAWAARCTPTHAIQDLQLPKSVCDVSVLFGTTVIARQKRPNHSCRYVGAAWPRSARAVEPPMQQRAALPTPDPHGAAPGQPRA